MLFFRISKAGGVGINKAKTKQDRIKKQANTGQNSAGQ